MGKITLKEQLEIIRYRMKLRNSYKKSSVLELQIALDELQKEIERRNKEK